MGVVVMVVLLLGALNLFAVLLDLLQQLLFTRAPRVALRDDFHPNLLQRSGRARCAGHDLHECEELIFRFDGEFLRHARAMAMTEPGGTARGATVRVARTHSSSD